MMKNHNRKVNTQFVTCPTAWALSAIYDTAADDLFNQGDYSINDTR